AYIILKSKHEVEKLFYKYYFKTADYIKLLNKKLEGIRDGKMISYSYFSEIELPYPTINEQIKIASMLIYFERKIEIEKQVLRLYNNQKRYLLKNLFI
ncbi:restriction endonuclease subunit S, partial [Flavobacterium sp.]